MSRVKRHVSGSSDKTNFDDIIKLQLHKPKKWSWELNTSRSSPHIPLPVIQLFDDNKQLLLETKRNDRRTWHESDTKRYAKYYTIPEQDIISNNYQIESPKSYKPKHSYTTTDLKKLNTAEKIRIKEHLLRKAQSDVSSRSRKSKSSTFRTKDDSYDSISSYPRLEKYKENYDIMYTNYINNNSIKNDDKRYSLVSSNAGTLLVKEDSKKYEKRRRRKGSEDKKSREKDSCDTTSKNYDSKSENNTSPDVIIIRRSSEKDFSRKENEAKKTDKKKPHEKTLVKENGSDLVKCDDELRMGANFSRHSSKGLSGRRCQSISNICNSKDPSGREVDAAYKFCNSMPSPNGTVYNNNYQHKPLAKKSSLPHTVSEHVIEPEHQPLQWKFTDTQTLCDQGYGSERSPEEEAPPPLPDHHQYDCVHMLDCCYAAYPFITTENTFEVELIKGSRGLGLSVCGGVDSDGSWPGLLRIKRLFPHQPAATSGLLAVGDLLLEANGISLTGLSNYEALEVLRMTPNKVVLLVCRPPAEVLNTMSPVSDVPPPPPRRTCSPTTSHQAAALLDDIYDAEFDIVLTKIHGSLGFTLCKEEEGIEGHYVRALVREPAISDGRIQPGDKIIAVNGVEITSMNHEQAVQFLRQCENEVHLRLYRELDKASTDLSPTQITPNSSFRPKPNLRQEAMDMLSDLAARKLSAGSPCTSPRHHHLQHLHHHHHQQLQYQQQAGLLNDSCTGERCRDNNDNDDDDDDDDDDKVVRPCFLDLYNPNQTPVAVRKSKINLSLAHNAYELNNLDPAMLDAPNLYSSVTESGAGPPQHLPDEPVSMPPLSCTHFSYKKPTYQSAHPQLDCFNNSSSSSSSVMATVAAAPPPPPPPAPPPPLPLPLPLPPPSNVDNITISTISNNNSTCSSSSLPETRDSKEKDLLDNDAQILNIELNRGWNSRLGFSLQEMDGCTCVSAVYPDSVAAKDGRLRRGDCLLRVNDEIVENMKTSDVIDLLRIIRGPVCITVLRRKPRLD